MDNSSKILSFVFFVIAFFFWGCPNEVSKSCACADPELSTVSAVTRSQYAYYLENQRFATSLSELGLGFAEFGKKYRYSMKTINHSKGHEKTYFYFYAVSNELFVTLKFISANTIIPDPSDFSSHIPTSVICRTNSSNESKPAEPQFQNGTFSCGDHTEKIEI